VKTIWLFLALALTAGAQITSQDLAKGPNQNWLTYIGDYSAHRHSPLTQINTRTVTQLTPKWVRHFDTPGDLETAPLVANGVMYATSSNEVLALDAVTGREVWRYRALGAQRRGANRGAAILAIACSSSPRIVIWSRYEAPPAA